MTQHNPGIDTGIVLRLLFKTIISADPHSWSPKKVPTQTDSVKNLMKKMVYMHLTGLV